MKINRLYFNKLWKEKSEPQISILLGPRQVGKSTLLRELEAKARETGLSTAFYDCEQPSDLQRLSGPDQAVIEELTKQADVIFIDEFHYIKNASKILKAIYDRQQRKTSPHFRKVKIYASGSSSLEIHKHLKESLAGRYIKTIIFPLSIEEWKQWPQFTDKEYLQWGGLPGLIHQSNPESRLTLLENILSTYITKDIKGLIKEENIRAFNTLLHLLAQAQGSISVSSHLARDTQLSEPTVARHLEVMIQTYAMHVVSSYSTNLANELKKSKKYYLFDIGIRNILLRDVRPVDQREDKGALYETAVLLHLIAQLKPNMEVRFWRTKKGDEVDFVLLKNRVPVPIEVKSHLSAPDVPKGMRQFLQRYPKAPFGIVFNENLEESVEIDKRKIIFKHWTQAANLEYLQSVV